MNRVFAIMSRLIARRVAVRCHKVLLAGKVNWSRSLLSRRFVVFAHDDGAFMGRRFARRVQDPRTMYEHEISRVDD